MAGLVAAEPTQSEWLAWRKQDRKGAEREEHKEQHLRLQQGCSQRQTLAGARASQDWFGFSCFVLKPF
jgi:hypothetical protein